ncbi:MAG: ATP-dependent helicase [Actinomycetota bacterium]|nr:ATP-dependent helicase [Actinomycetota bacterium]
MLTGTAPRRPGAWDPVAVLGGPGTGKTSLLVDLAVRRLSTPGVAAESVLVLTASRRAAGAVRREITERLTVAGRGGVATIREPLVRTLHSYAFAVLRLQAAAHENPPPRLISGAEQDAVIRELLRGEIVDGAAHWPATLRPALGMAGFARELRDLLLRATERGIGPEELVQLGRRNRRPEWVAAGRFGVRYEQVMLLRAAVGMEAPQASAPAVDAAGLIAGALDAFTADPALLSAERSRVGCLLVDDAQHLDPLGAALVRTLGAGEVVVAGDPDQAIFGFRGADSRLLAEVPRERTLLLSTSRRLAGAVADAVAVISSRLPGVAPQRGPAAADDAAAGHVMLRLLRSEAQEAAFVADVLRRAHLLDGVPYAEMAVIVRSTVRSLPTLRRALLAAGVPLRVPSTDLPPARQYAVQGFLLTLRALAADGVSSDFDEEAALALLTSAVGRADPVALRRLRRGLRRGELLRGGDRASAELIRTVLLSPPGLLSPTGVSARDLLGALTATEAEPLRRVLKVLAAARTVVADGRGVEDVLWAVWQASGLESRWVAAAGRGGAAGTHADRDLDAVLAMFDAAARYVDRLPAGGVSGFVEYLTEQQLPSGFGDARGDAVESADAVTVLTAHSASGQQWRLVAVAGVQEGLWPTLRSRGSLLGTERLVDIVSAGTDPEVVDTLSSTAPLLAAERRLFLVACARASETLLVTAVDSATGDTDLLPSRFVAELAAHRGDDVSQTETGAPQADRALALGELVAQLRAVVCAEDAEPERRELAVAQLARLAAAGVRGAHPEQWYGLAEASTRVQLWQPGDGPVSVSPSAVDLLATCPLRWLLERHGGQDGSSTAAVTGTLVHTLVEAIAERARPEAVDAALQQAWLGVDVGAPWHSRHELQRHRAMLENFRQWLQRTRAELTEVAVELPVDVVLQGVPSGGDGQTLTVQVSGRIDRLERDARGRLVVVDVKTSKNPVSASAAQQHAQLATYQLATAHGGLAGIEAAGQPGGGRLVYVAKANRIAGATQREQPPLSEGETELWRSKILDAAAATSGPQFLARVNEGCTHCPVRGACPAQDSGRQVGGA